MAASVPEAPIFMDLSDVKPAGLDHLQMNENWTPFYQAFPLNPYGHYWHLDHSLPSSSTTPSGLSSSPEAQQETSTPGSTNGIQNPEASSSRTINGVQNPAHPEAATSRIKIPEVSKGPSAGEALGMAGYMKHKATSRRSFIPKSGTWKPWQRPRFKSGCRGMKFLRLENYHSKGFKSTQCFMNTICNMLYSCSEFRELFLKYGDHSSTANKIAEIFKVDRMTPTRADGFFDRMNMIAGELSGNPAACCSRRQEEPANHSTNLPIRNCSCSILMERHHNLSPLEWKIRYYKNLDDSHMTSAEIQERNSASKNNGATEKIPVWTEQEIQESGNRDPVRLLQMVTCDPSTSFSHSSPTPRSKDSSESSEATDIASPSSSSSSTWMSSSSPSSSSSASRSSFTLVSAQPSSSGYGLNFGRGTWAHPPFSSFPIFGQSSDLGAPWFSASHPPPAAPHNSEVNIESDYENFLSADEDSEEERPVLKSPESSESVFANINKTDNFFDKICNVRSVCSGVQRWGPLVVLDSVEDS
ncbi:unnamed protein product [Caenorhabditis nigoni]